MCLISEAVIILLAEAWKPDRVCFLLRREIKWTFMFLSCSIYSGIHRSHKVRWTYDHRPPWTALIRWLWLQLTVTTPHTSPVASSSCLSFAACSLANLRLARCFKGETAKCWGALQIFLRSSGQRRCGQIPSVMLNTLLSFLYVSSLAIQEQCDFRLFSISVVGMTP